MTPKEYLQPYEGSFSLKEVSYLSLKPGDIIIFNYEDGDRRIGLVVSSQRTSTGVFLSTRNNQLLNVVEVESLSQGMFDAMINTLHKRVRRCSYYSKRILGAFLGRESFKTFNVAYIRNILDLSIDG